MPRLSVIGYTGADAGEPGPSRPPSPAGPLPLSFLALVGWPCPAAPTPKVSLLSTVWEAGLEGWWPSRPLRTHTPTLPVGENCIFEKLFKSRFICGRSSGRAC